MTTLLTPYVLALVDSNFGAAFSTEIEHLPRAASRARTVAGGGAVVTVHVERA